MFDPVEFFVDLGTDLLVGVGPSPRSSLLEIAAAKYPGSPAMLVVLGEVPEAVTDGAERIALAASPDGLVLVYGDRIAIAEWHRVAALEPRVDGVAVTVESTAGEPSRVFDFQRVAPHPLLEYLDASLHRFLTAARALRSEG